MNAVKVKNRLKGIGALTIAVLLGFVLYGCGGTGMTSDPMARVPKVDDHGRGGTLRIGLPDFPKSFNGYLNNYTTVGMIFGMMYESLAFMDDETAEWKPLLANKWNTSRNKKEFTFHINPNARFNDGTPVTTEDVLFTYTTLTNTNNLTVGARILLSKFEPLEVIDKYQFRFKAHKAEFGLFAQIAGMEILPKHLYEGKDFNSMNNNLPAGSGPYSMTKLEEGYSLTMTKNTNWWGDQEYDYNKTNYYFEKIRFKSYGAAAGVFEAFKKGEIHATTINKASRWATETSFDKITNNYIVKQSIYTKRSRTIQGLYFNLRRSLFQDKRVRLALAHLFNRKKMVESMMYNQYELLSSYYPSHFRRGSNEIVLFDPQKALNLLKEAGWTNTDKDPILVKDGQRFSFTIPYFSDGFERYFTIFKEDCKKVGVEVLLDKISWSAFTKLTEDYNFDVVNMARYTGYLFFNPEYAWHSKTIHEKNGANISGYSNATVDSLIDTLSGEFNFEKRVKLLKKIENLLYNDHLVALQWGLDYERLLYWNIFDTPPEVLSKTGHNTTSYIISKWRFNPDKWNAMNEARKNKTALPAPPKVIRVKPLPVSKYNFN